jgi:hypothetical protein
LQGRNAEKLQAVRQACEEAGSPGVHIVELELSNVPGQSTFFSNNH